MARLKTVLTPLQESLLKIWRANILPHGLLSWRRYRRTAKVVLLLTSSLLRLSRGVMVGGNVLLSGTARPVPW